MSVRVDGGMALVSGGTVRVGGNGLQLRRMVRRVSAEPRYLTGDELI